MRCLERVGTKEPAFAGDVIVDRHGLANASCRRLADGDTSKVRRQVSDFGERSDLGAITTLSGHVGRIANADILVLLSQEFSETVRKLSNRFQ